MIFQPCAIATAAVLVSDFVDDEIPCFGVTKKREFPNHCFGNNSSLDEELDRASVEEATVDSVSKTSFKGTLDAIHAAATPARMRMEPTPDELLRFGTDAKVATSDNAAAHSHDTAGTVVASENAAAHSNDAAVRRDLLPISLLKARLSPGSPHLKRAKTKSGACSIS
jgi:hypothetical protein